MSTNPCDLSRCCLAGQPLTEGMEHFHYKFTVCSPSKVVRKSVPRLHDKTSHGTLVHKSRAIYDGKSDCW